MEEGGLGDGGGEEGGRGEGRDSTVLGRRGWGENSREGRQRGGVGRGGRRAGGRGSEGGEVRGCGTVGMQGGEGRGWRGEAGGVEGGERWMEG